MFPNHRTWLLSSVLHGRRLGFQVLSSQTWNLVSEEGLCKEGYAAGATGLDRWCHWWDGTPGWGCVGIRRGGLGVFKTA